MCGKNGKVVIIDFGLASKIGEPLPPNHVLRPYCKEVSDEDLESNQNLLIQDSFNPMRNEENAMELSNAVNKYKESCFFKKPNEKR